MIRRLLEIHLFKEFFTISLINGAKLRTSNIVDKQIKTNEWLDAEVGKE